RRGGLRAPAGPGGRGRGPGTNRRGAGGSGGGSGGGRARGPRPGRGGARGAGGCGAMAGRGVQAQVDGVTVAVGGPALLRELAVPEPGELAAEAAGWRGRGATVLFVVGDDKVLGALALEDT